MSRAHRLLVSSVQGVQQQLLRAGGVSPPSDPLLPTHPRTAPWARPAGGGGGGVGRGGGGGGRRRDTVCLMGPRGEEVWTDFGLLPIVLLQLGLHRQHLLLLLPPCSSSTAGSQTNNMLVILTHHKHRTSYASAY